MWLVLNSSNGKLIYLLKSTVSNFASVSTQPSAPNDVTSVGVHQDRLLLEEAAFKKEYFHLKKGISTDSTQLLRKPKTLCNNLIISPSSGLPTAPPHQQAVYA